jgi:hypothetical protein
MPDEPTAADAVALLRAHLRGDTEAVETLLDSCELRDLFAVLTGLLVDLLASVLQDGREQLDQWAEQWQADYRATL